MTISSTDIHEIAGNAGFSPVFVEKVIFLMHLLDSLNRHPFLQGSWVLKGGTALNLFLFELPRLSVDIDLNYIGSLDRDTMMADRSKIEQACQAVFSREGFTIKRIPTEHAGGKWILTYQSYTGQTGNLEVDFNFMFRQPLWQPELMDSVPLGNHRVTNIPVLDKHELTAGKLAALFARTQARDLFDTVSIFNNLRLDTEKLRLAFIVYGAMNRVDWRTVSLHTIDIDTTDLSEKLVPVLRLESDSQGYRTEAYIQKLVNECKKGLSALFPYTDDEKRFLDILLDEGRIDPSLLTDDRQMRERISNQPLLQWKALNVRDHKGLDPYE